MVAASVRQRPSFIYALVDPRTNEVGYVGKTRVSLGARLRSHVHRALVEMPLLEVSRWISPICKDGFRPEPVLLETVPEDQDWCEAESFWVGYMKSLGARLTNLTTGGTVGTVVAPEVRVKIRVANTGKSVSPEARAKISAANKGRKLTPEQIERRAAAQRGAKRTPEFAAQCAERQRSRKGTYTLSEEASAKVSERVSGERNPFYGKTHSEATRQLLSQAGRGRKHTDEAKRLISEASYARWQRQRSDSQMVSSKTSPGTTSADQLECEVQGSSSREAFRKNRAS